MEARDSLTNESLNKKFKSQFDLVSYAIRLASNMIHTGRDARVRIDSQNRAMQVLAEIRNGEDRFDELIVKEEVSKEGHQFHTRESEHVMEKPEKRKVRRVFED